MKIEVLDKNGKKVEDLTLAKEVFGQEVNNALLSQYIHIYRTNQRQGTSSTKTRSEVSGGGRKPWRQKGTGRARHGSIRSPIWVGGGVAHGPRPRKWSLKLSKSLRRKAMQSALSLKFNQGSLKALDSISTDKPNTQYIYNILNKLELPGKTLLVLAKGDKNILKSVSNLENADVSEMDNLNVYELISAKNVLFEKEALQNLQKKYK